MSTELQQKEIIDALLNIARVKGNGFMVNKRGLQSGGNANFMNMRAELMAGRMKRPIGRPSKGGMDPHQISNIDACGYPIPYRKSLGREGGSYEKYEIARLGKQSLAEKEEARRLSSKMNKSYGKEYQVNRGIVAGGCNGCPLCGGKLSGGKLSGGKLSGGKLSGGVEMMINSGRLQNSYGQYCGGRKPRKDKGQSRETDWIKLVKKVQTDYGLNYSQALKKASQLRKK